MVVSRNALPVMPRWSVPPVMERAIPVGPTSAGLVAGMACAKAGTASCATETGRSRLISSGRGERIILLRDRVVWLRRRGT